MYVVSTSYPEWEEQAPQVREFDDPAEAMAFFRQAVIVLINSDVADASLVLWYPTDEGRAVVASLNLACTTH